jgi:maltose O-acetyltransferase
MPYTDVPPIRPSRRRDLLARVRGEQTLRRLRRAGLHAPGPVLISARVYIDEAFAWAISIGQHVRIAHDARVIAHDAAVKHLTGYTEVLPVTIGDRCYVGAGAVVLPGAPIGAEAVIGAGAIVRGEVPAGAVAVGNPARVIGEAVDLRDRHIKLQSRSPCFERRPSDGLTPEELAAMQRALAEAGRIYVH